MSLADELSSAWGITDTKKKPKAKKQVKPKPRKKVSNVPEVAKEGKKIDDFVSNIKKANKGKQNNFEDVAGLPEEALNSKYKQEIHKAEQLRLKVEQEKLKLKREAGQLIEYDLADYLFVGYLSKCNLQLLTLLRKHEPKIKNLCQENEPKQLVEVIQTAIEEVLEGIKIEQARDVKKWNKER